MDCFDVYISSSWKNRVVVREIANTLRVRGLSVYDFTDPACRSYPEIPPEKFPEPFDPERHVYSEYLSKNTEWCRAINENKQVLTRCGAVLLLLPCGIDATADWAFAVGHGKPSVVVGHPARGERSPVHLWADFMVETWQEAIDWLVKQKNK